MITIGQLIDVCNHGDNLIDEICGGNVSQTIDKLKAIVRGNSVESAVRAERLHKRLVDLEHSIKQIRASQLGVKL